MNIYIEDLYKSVILLNIPFASSYMRRLFELSYLPAFIRSNREVARQPASETPRRLTASVSSVSFLFSISTWECVNHHTCLNVTKVVQLPALLVVFSGAFNHSLWSSSVDSVDVWPALCMKPVFKLNMRKKVCERSDAFWYLWLDCTFCYLYTLITWCCTIKQLMWLWGS